MKAAKDRMGIGLTAPKEPIDMSNSGHPSRPVAVEDRNRAADARHSRRRPRAIVCLSERVLTRVLPKKGTVLEIGSGTGEHVLWHCQSKLG